MPIAAKRERGNAGLSSDTGTLLSMESSSLFESFAASLKRLASFYAFSLVFAIFSTILLFSETRMEETRSNAIVESSKFNDCSLRSVEHFSVFDGCEGLIKMMCWRLLRARSMRGFGFNPLSQIKPKLLFSALNNDESFLHLLTSNLTLPSSRRSILLATISINPYTKRPP